MRHRLHAWWDKGIPDDDAVKMRWFHEMMKDVNNAAQFEMACIVAKDVRKNGKA